MSGAFAPATEAFERVLKELEVKPEQDDLAALGRRAGLVVAANSAWDRHLGPMFDAEQAKMMLGVSSRQAVSDLAKRGRLLALEVGRGRKRYPAFQFGEDGRPHGDLVPILALFAPVVETPYTIASWLVSPNPLLENETPVAWMRSGRPSARLQEAARRAVQRLAH